MTGWRIDPAGLNTILTGAETGAQTIATSFQTAADTVETVVGAAGATDGLVANAFAEFMQEQYEHELKSAMTRIGAVLEGTANAANAYLAGDQQMAEAIVADITNAAVTGDTSGLSWSGK